MGEWANKGSVREETSTRASAKSRAAESVRKRGRLRAVEVAYIYRGECQRAKSERKRESSEPEHESEPARDKSKANISHESKLDNMCEPLELLIGRI